jgi:hypothetical protein
MNNFDGMTHGYKWAQTTGGFMGGDLCIESIGAEEVRMEIKREEGDTLAFIYIHPDKVRTALAVALNEVIPPSQTGLKRGDRVALTGPHNYHTPGLVAASWPAPNGWLGTVFNEEDFDGDVAVEWDNGCGYTSWVNPASLTKVTHDFRIGDRVVVGYDGPFFDLAGGFATIVGGPRAANDGFELDVQPEKEELRWRLEAESGIKGWGQPASNLTIADGVKGVGLAAGDVLVLNEDTGMYGMPGARAIYLRDCEHDDELIFVRFIRDGRQGGFVNGNEEAVLRMRFDRGDLDERAANALIRQTLSV